MIEIAKKKTSEYYKVKKNTLWASIVFALLLSMLIGSWFFVIKFQMESCIDKHSDLSFMFVMSFFYLTMMATFGAAYLFDEIKGGTS